MDHTLSLDLTLQVTQTDVLSDHHKLESYYKATSPIITNLHHPVGLFLPVAVVVVGIVASQSCETAQADGIGEEDLGSCIHPYLIQKWHKDTIHVRRGESELTREVLVHHEPPKEHLYMFELCYC